MTKVGLITVGQAPRSDVVPDMAAILGGDVEIVEAGALDGLTRAQMEPLAPEGDDEILVTRLADGSLGLRRQEQDDLAHRGEDRRARGSGRRAERAAVHRRVPEAAARAARSSSPSSSCWGSSARWSSPAAWAC